MQIQFLGAAQTVTGSCYILEAGGLRFAVDFGMYQGNKVIEERNRSNKLYKAASLDFILLTHAHIDHSGLLPKAVKDGFDGPIYCTEPTATLLDVMLLDSAHIQEMDAAWNSQKRVRVGHSPVDPLYTSDDARKTMTLVKPVPFGQQVTFGHSGIRFTFRSAGHILGAAFLELVIEDEGKVKTLVFSGDLGRTGALLMHDPETPKLTKPDFLFLESTYGDRNHRSSQSSMEELEDAINYSYAHKEKVIIPAFAIERTQEILFVLREFQLKGKIPADMPVFVDSPLAIKATEIFRRNYSFFDKKVTDVVLAGGNPFEFENLHYTPKAEQSQALNSLTGPAIIISASGMCNAGRIKHHLRHNLWRKGASIVFTGYQAFGTPGRRIVDGDKTVPILGENVVVAAKIYTIGGLSAHAGQDHLVSWTKEFVDADTLVFLMHGEEKTQNALEKRLHDEVGVKTHIPKYLETVELHADGVPSAEYAPQIQPVDWDKVVYLLRVELEGFEQNISAVTDKPVEEQWEVVDRLQELRSRLHSLVFKNTSEEFVEPEVIARSIGNGNGNGKSNGKVNGNGKKKA